MSKWACWMIAGLLIHGTTVITIEMIDHWPKEVKTVVYYPVYVQDNGDYYRYDR